MPIDLNRFDADSLAKLLRGLKPGQATVSNDGIVIRRRSHTSGFDFGVGRGGHGTKRLNSADEAAVEWLNMSAQRSHPDALGGEESFDHYEDARFAMGQGPDPKADSNPLKPALSSIKTTSTKASLHSYRVRAKKASEALKKGDVTSAVGHLESIIGHARASGHTEDAKRAQTALSDLRAVNATHSIASERAPDTSGLTIRIRDGAHYVCQGRRELTGPLSGAEAESRRNFIAREQERHAGVQEINNELAGLPNVVARVERPVRAEERVSS